MRWKEYICHPPQLICSLARRGLLNWLPDKPYLKLMYAVKTGSKLNLSSPKTFNEKIQWLKLYDRRPEYTAMVDKYEAKRYVAGIIGEEYIISTLGVWDRFEDIDFDALPYQFVLKCTHDSGGLVICRDKDRLDKDAAREKIERALKRNYFWSGREWPYKNIKPRIIAEEYLSEEHSSEIIDYKFMCFDGEVKCCFTCTGRFDSRGLHVTFFDREWNKLPFEREYPSEKTDIPKPKNFEKMLELAERLSRNMTFLRVDFYEVGCNVFFGELTFFPGGGYEMFSPSEWDETIGEWIDLPQEKK